ncbi:MAG: alpha/beta hydrolase [Microbacteriaceae bacterium]|nr:alpha/beta hydrolase [Microbacteriaceae bacterium]
MTERRPWIQKPGHYIPLAALVLGVAFTVVSVLSPWPASLLIRALFESGGQKTAAEMLPHVPKTGVTGQLDVSYGTHGKDTTFDIFAPTGTTTPLPTVVWIHGGAWISGSKEQVDPYVKIIAARGFTTVALNYTVSPEATYPTALKQLNDALGFLVKNAAKYNIDPDRIVIAGDSAGANLTSQLASLVTSPKYATTVGIQPSLTPEQLRAVVLDCGIYDVKGIPDVPGLVGWGFRTALWAYIGQKDWSAEPGGQQMGVLDDVTSAFPTTWISGGNGDPLTDSQSKPLAARLTSLGVDVTPVFYPKSTTPELPHEYQFHLDMPRAQTALESTVTFLQRVTG